MGTSSPSNTAGFGRQLEIAGSVPCITINQNDAGFATRKYSLAVNTIGDFGIWDNTTSSYRFYINTSGNVGIGVINPSNTLDVNGTARFRLGGTNQLVVSTDSGNPYLYVEQNAPLNFGTNSQIRATLDASGNLGLGVTPSAWGSNYVVLQTSNGGAFWSSKSGSPTVITSANASFDGSSYKYLANNAATLAIQSGGSHQWFTAPSGTAGDPITFTQAMTLDASGRLLVGTSTYDGNGVAVIQGVAADATGPGVLDLRRGTTRPAGADTSIGYLRFMSTSQTSANYHYAYIAAFSDGASSSDADIPGRLVFATTADGASSPTERARIDSSGRLLVGATGQGAFTSILTLSYDAGTTKWSTGPYSGNATGFVISANVSYGVYLASTTSTSWATASDERLKTDLEPIENGLLKVDALRAVTGRYAADSDGPRKPFLIAQDVLQVLPEAVDTSNPERYGLAYTEVIPLLVAALKESKARIETLEAKVAALEAA